MLYSRKLFSRKSSSLICVLSALVTPLLMSSPVFAQQSILSVGDSIVQGTAGQCSFRLPLSKMMFNDASCQVSFVGSRTDPFRPPTNGNCTAADFTDHFAESGRRADFFLSRLGAEVQNEAPDYVIMHVGSNDMNQNQTVETTIDEISALMTTVFAERPNATILMGNIIPWDDSRTGEPGTTDRIAALGIAVEALVAQRRSQGDSVEIVDVRSGFDTDTMTVDGVHPNSVGERLMADRFLARFDQLGLCNTFTLPQKTLINGDWYQISLPADPGSNNRVRDLFSDDLPIDQMANGTPGQGTWTMFEYVNSGSGASEDSYRRLGPDDRLNAGTGYWIRQVTGSSVQIDMPPLSLPSTLSAEAACASGRGCVAVPLSADANGVRWNLVGNPFTLNRPYGSVRVDTDSSTCSDGCTPAEASSGNVAGDVLFRYNDAANRYDRITSGSSLSVWDAGWLGVLPGAQGRDARLLFSAGN